jgi:hypothetical protein
VGNYDFTPAVAAKIAQAAMHFCSNPTCLRLTGYPATEEKVRAVAEAAHILPSGNGARAREIGDTPITELKTAKNGIWLCAICHGIVDNDEARYKSTVLREWKARHEEVIRRIVGKDLERVLIELRNTIRNIDEAREFISFMEDRRMLYESLDVEFPPRVLESIEQIRSKVREMRARVNHSGDFFVLLGDVQDLINAFLRNIGPETNLVSLRCDSNDPVRNRFAGEVKAFRLSIALALKALSGNCDYKLRYL